MVGCQYRSGVSLVGGSLSTYPRAATPLAEIRYDTVGSGEFRTELISQVVRCRSGGFDVKSRCGRRLGRHKWRRPPRRGNPAAFFKVVCRGNSGKQP